MDLYDDDMWKHIAKVISQSEEFQRGESIYAGNFLPQTFVCEGRDQILQYIRHHEDKIFVEVLVEIGRDVAFVPCLRDKKPDILIKHTDMYGYEEYEE